MEFVTDWARAATARRDMIVIAIEDNLISQNGLTNHQETVIEYYQICNRSVEAIQTQINIYRFCSKAKRTSMERLSIDETLKVLEGREYIARMLKRLAMYTMRLIRLDERASRLLIRYTGDQQDTEELRADYMRRNLLNTLDNSTLELGNEERIIKEEMTNILHYHGVIRRCFARNERVN